MSRGKRPGPRAFDPVEVGNLETAAWAAYYRHEWRAFLRAAVGMVGAGFAMGRLRTLQGAWYVQRATSTGRRTPTTTRTPPDHMRGYVKQMLPARSRAEPSAWTSPRRTRGPSVTVDLSVSLRHGRRHALVQPGGVNVTSRARRC